jgi:hypothetical protein
MGMVGTPRPVTWSTLSPAQQRMLVHMAECDRAWLIEDGPDAFAPMVVQHLEDKGLARVEQRSKGGAPVCATLTPLGRACVNWKG